MYVMELRERRCHFTM